MATTSPSWPCSRISGLPATRLDLRRRAPTRSASRPPELTVPVTRLAHAHHDGRAQQRGTRQARDRRAIRSASNAATRSVRGTAGRPSEVRPSATSSATPSPSQSARGSSPSGRSGITRTDGVTVVGLRDGRCRQARRDHEPPAGRRRCLPAASCRRLRDVEPHEADAPRRPLDTRRCRRGEQPVVCDQRLDEREVVAAVGLVRVFTAAAENRPADLEFEPASGGPAPGPWCRGRTTRNDASPASPPAAAATRSATWDRRRGRATAVAPATRWPRTSPAAS